MFIQQQVQEAGPKYQHCVGTKPSRSLADMLVLKRYPVLYQLESSELLTVLRRFHDGKRKSTDLELDLV